MAPCSYSLCVSDDNKNPNLQQTKQKNIFENWDFFFKIGKKVENGAKFWPYVNTKKTTLAANCDLSRTYLNRISP